MLGFCPKGPNCKFHHLLIQMPPEQEKIEYLKRSD